MVLLDRGNFLLLFKNPMSLLEPLKGLRTLTTSVQLNIVALIHGIKEKNNNDFMFPKILSDYHILVTITFENSTNAILTITLTFNTLILVITRITHVFNIWICNFNN